MLKAMTVCNEKMLHSAHDKAKCYVSVFFPLSKCLQNTSDSIKHFQQRPENKWR